jgi:hypothetical protein
MSTTTTETTDTRTKTAYHILREIKTGSEITGYEPVVANVEAASADAAIRAYFDRNTGATGGTFLAIPARSWKPVTVKVETQTVVKLG